MSWQDQIEIINITDTATAARLMGEVGADSAGIELMLPKARHYCLKLKDVPARAANILKQELLARGGEAAMAAGVAGWSVDRTDILIFASRRQLELLLAKLPRQGFGLDKLADGIREALDNWEEQGYRQIACPRGPLSLGQRTLVMGIVNVTPDSFSDGGHFYDPGAAVEHAHRLIAEGADIIDVGGESTRPGHEPVDTAEEWRRLEPVLRRLIKEIKVPISVDTYKAITARRALEMGVDIINDIWGFQADPEMARVCGQYQVAVILMHNHDGTQYRDLMFDILNFLRTSIKLAEDNGVPAEKIIIDPGIGFGKDLAQNLEVMARLGEFKVLGKPLLLGTSRKSIIGKTLDLPVDQRLEGTAATVALGIACGADIVRVHDVQAMVRVARMTDAIVRRS
ncbi:dihydropteroate synthase [Moorella sp. Hama-1]|uniref:dihydropteroate synthase n=1 Tax=Moorella sp. Hama-1 TaxID=2138101 RepID=UPI0020462B78|nr:dihydropteroate synthase [Moorella sp. Hama-1]BCV20059.1 dihydropteroate synthase [Moorella sp. Hama-1]